MLSQYQTRTRSIKKLLKSPKLKDESSEIVVETDEAKKKEESEVQKDSDIEEKKSNGSNESNMT